LLADDLQRRVGDRRPRPNNRVDLSDADVGAIDVAYIGQVAGIGGPIDLARRKRKPTDWRSGTDRDRYGHRYRRWRNEGDQCRRINRLGGELSGHPSPAVVDASPPPVMTRPKRAFYDYQCDGRAA
jgi:hypothetical protein